MTYIHHWEWVTKQLRLAGNVCLSIMLLSIYIKNKRIITVSAYFISNKLIGHTSHVAAGYWLLDSGYFPNTLSSDRTKNSFCSGVPIVTRIASLSPKLRSGLIVTPSAIIFSNAAMQS